MPSDRTLKDLQFEVEADTQKWFPEVTIDLAYLTICLTGEAGEFANIVKKVMRGSLDFDTGEVRVDAAFELADVLIYLLMISNILGIDLAETYKMKREYNAKRFETSITNDGDLQF